MNDDFLSKFRQSPRPEFAQSLYAQLTHNAKARPLISRHSTAKRIAFALAALSVMFVLTIAVSPAVRAAVDNIIAKITVGGTTVIVSEEPPAPSGAGESYSLIWTPVSPNDISANYSFFARLPAWVPSGYTLQARGALYYLSMFDETPFSSLFEWKNDVGETIQLYVLKGSCPNGPSHDPALGCTLASYIIVGLESEPEVIAINGQPGIFYRGVTGLADLSGSVRKWNPSRWKPNKDVTKGASMIWESDGRTFILAVESTTITQEGLLRIAESIP